MTDDAISALEDWLEERPSLLTGDDLASTFGDASNWLISSGIARRTGRSHVAVCTRCDDPHPADIDFDPWRAEWGYSCDSVWTAVSPDRSLTYTICIDAFVERLAAAIGANDVTRRMIRKQSLYCLGIAGREKPWTALFARHLSDGTVFEGILSDLKRPVGKEPGLLITSSDAPRSLDLPGAHRVAWLREVVEIADTGLVARPGLDLLGAGGRRPRRKTGPKTLKDEARKYVRSRLRHGLKLPPDDEVTLVIGELRRRHPECSLPRKREIRYAWLGDLLGDR